MKKDTQLVLLTLLILFCFIVPFVWVSKYVIPNTDDLCRAAMPNQEYFARIKNWYLTHNGRFMNAVFTLLPVYKITVYRIIVAVQFPIFGYIIYRFFDSVFKSYSIRINSKEIFFISAIFLILIIATVPTIFDFFYWYAAVTVYLFSFYFFLIFLQSCLKIHFTGERNFYVLAGIILCMVGNNELLLGIINFFLILLIVTNYLKNRKWDSYLILLTIISIGSSIAVILSPGTVSRRGQFDYGGNFYGSAKVALKYGAKFTLESLLDLPLILFCVFIFFLIYKKPNSLKQGKFISPLLLLIITYISLCTVFFILFYATGLLDIYTGRIANFVICLSLILIILNVINLAVFMRVKCYNRILKIRPFYYYILIIIFLAFVGFRSSNYIDLRKDFLQGNLERFDQDFEERIQKIERNKNKVIELRKIQNTHLLRSGDNGLINDEWVKDCYIRFLNRTNNNSIRELYIEQ